MNNIKIILIYGNGKSTMNDHWLPYVKTELEKHGLTVIAKDFPDLPLARSLFWLPFIKQLGANENTVLIGHSTGAVASMRYAEQSKILGSVIVGAYYTDLGYADEKAGGYFDQPWDWDKIKQNQKFIIQFASQDDPYIPIEDARFIHQKLNTEYHEYVDQGHMSSDVNKTSFPDLVESLLEKINSLN